MPKVTVAVITFNSSEFICEALNSIIAQSYKNIELIISDDASADDTLKVSKDWLEKNKHRFINAIMLESKKNTGVSANVNRALEAATGEWMCFLAGDDALKPNCIEDNLKWVESNKDCKVLFSQMDVYQDTFEKQNFINTTPLDPYNAESIMAHGRTATSQNKMLLLCDRIHYTPTLFINRNILNSVGGFDERFKYFEDYPLWLNLTKNGHIWHFRVKPTVNYRRHSMALNSANTNSACLINPNYFKQESFRRLYTYPYLPLDIKLQQRFNWMVLQVFKPKLFNKSNILTKFIRDVLTNYFNPFKYLIHIRIKMNKSLGSNEFYQSFV